VYYGLKNDGAAVVCDRLRGRAFPIPIGVSVAKTNSRETCDVPTGIADYAKAFGCAVDVASYITVNISCPNTFGGEPFTDPTRLEALLTRLDQIPTDKPVFIKLSPDLTFSAVDELLDVAGRHRVHGIVCANLTKVRANERIKDADVPEQGGLSGKVVEPLADALIAHVYARAGERFTVIGVGGVFTAEDAYRKIRLGASLIQLITGMIYRGPQTISEINQGLVRLLRRDGFASVSEAVGTARTAHT
jgi:dihydroorotate dehydrogenase